MQGQRACRTNPGISFSEIEEFCIEVLSRRILSHTQDNPKEIIKSLERRFVLGKPGQEWNLAA